MRIIALIEQMDRFVRDLFKSLTRDRGKEMASKPDTLVELQTSSYE